MTGVMILLTLLMALELVEKIETSPLVLTENLTAELKEQLDKINQDVIQLSKRVNDARDQTVAFTNTTLTELQNEIVTLEAELDALQVKNKEVKDTQIKLENTKSEIDKAEESQDQMMAELARIEISIKDIKSRIFKVNEGMIVLLEPRAGDKREPWIIEVFADKIMVASTKNSRAVFKLKDVKALERWMGNRKPHRDYFFLLGHRTGFDLLREVKDLLITNNFDYGIDLLLDDQNAIECQQELNQ